MKKDEADYEYEQIKNVSSAFFSRMGKRDSVKPSPLSFEAPELDPSVVLNMDDSVLNTPSIDLEADTSISDTPSVPFGKYNMTTKTFSTKGTSATNKPSIFRETSRVTLNEGKLSTIYFNETYPSTKSRDDRLFKILVQETWTTILTSVLPSVVVETVLQTTTITTVTFFTTSITTLRLTTSVLPDNIPEC